jgi:NUMOD4 motif
MTTISDERPETWKPVAPMDGCTFSGYEASDKGRYRSVDRKQGNRQLKGKVLATRRNDDGYVLVNIRCDSTDPAHSRVHTVTGHKVVLTTFDKPCSPGMEACHSDRGPAFNWWPEGIRWGTKPENHADMVAAGNAMVPEAFPCRNSAWCGGTVKTAGRRCAECVAEVGELAGQLLAFGMPLRKVAERFGYTGDDWVFKLAVEHGRYDESKAHARAQRPSPLQRVSLWWFLRSVHDV